MGHALCIARSLRRWDGWARFSLCAGALVAALGAAACASPSADRGGPYHRVVSLAPSTTELLFAIGAGDLVVGRTRWVTHPPEAFAVPAVGDGLDPNVEAVAGVQPDLVVLYDSPSNAQAERQLARLNVATLRFSMDRLDDVVRGARLLGELTGTMARAGPLADAFAGRLDSARAAIPTGARPTALILSWDQPPIVIGAGSFLSELLDLAGARNAFAHVRLPSGQVSIEAIAARDPDVVLVIGDDPSPPWMERQEWQVVRAVRQRRVVAVSSSAFAYPSFRAFEAVRELRDALARLGS